MPNSPSILSLDIGTSSARAMQFDATGHSLSGREARRAYEMETTPDGGVQMDPDALVDGVGACLEQMLKSGADAGRIEGVGVSTFWHSLMGIGDRGRPTTPLYSWADTRSGACSDALRHLLDANRVHERTGCVLHSSYWPAKITWLRTADPRAFQATRHWVSFAEYLYLQLFGKLCCSLSMASGTGLFLQSDCVWDPEMLAALDLDEAALPPLVDRDSALQGLRPEFAKRWPALSKVPWFPAVGDGACSNVGSGCLARDRAALMVGTSGAMRVVDADPVAGDGRHAGSEAQRNPAAPPSPDSPHPPSPADGLWSYRIDRRQRIVGGALSNGGNLFAWMRETLRLGDETAVEQALGRGEPGAHRLLVLPFFAGERSLGWHAHARAAVLGMTLNTQPLDILTAGLEAVACRFALLADALNLSVPGEKQFIASGGGLLNSPAWTQMVADALGQPLVASAEPEASSRGAALLAAEALRLIPDLDAAPAALGATHQPDAKRHVGYQALAQRMGRYYDLLVAHSVDADGPGVP